MTVNKVEIIDLNTLFVYCVFILVKTQTFTINYKYLVFDTAIVGLQVARKILDKKRVTMYSFMCIWLKFLKKTLAT